MNILYADDDCHVRWLTGTVLQSLGHKVHCCENGQEALTHLLAHPSNFDCVLLDREMPLMSGLDVLRAMKKTQRLAEIPVIFLTSHAGASEVAEGLNAGAQLYLAKPVPRKLLDAALAQVNALLAERTEIRSNMQEARQGLALADELHFSLQTPAQARQLTALLASLTPDPSRTAIGFSELLNNAIEHGNLGVNYEQKTALLEANNFQKRIEELLRDPVLGQRRVYVKAWRSDTCLTVTIEDEGDGFDWRPFLEFCPERAFDLHGRGIAISKKVAFDELHYLGRGNVVELKIYRQTELSPQISAELTA